MKLSAPKQATFVVGVVLALAGLLGELGTVAALGSNAFWLAFLGAVVLALGSYVKGL